jgi:hypothetical protein
MPHDVSGPVGAASESTRTFPEGLRQKIAGYVRWKLGQRDSRDRGSEFVAGLSWSIQQEFRSIEVVEDLESPDAFATWKLTVRHRKTGAEAEITDHSPFIGHEE